MYSVISDDEFHLEYTTEEVRVSKTHIPGCPRCIRVESSITALWAAQGAEFKGRQVAVPDAGLALDLHDAFGRCRRCEAFESSRAMPRPTSTETSAAWARLIPAVPG